MVEHDGRVLLCPFSFCHVEAVWNGLPKRRDSDLAGKIKLQGMTFQILCCFVELYT